MTQRSTLIASVLLFVFCFLVGQPTSAATVLAPGQAVSDSVGYQQWKYYEIAPSSAAPTVTVRLIGLSADLDLYARNGNLPTLTAYDCRPYNGGIEHESCILPASTTVYIGVYGFQAGSYTLSVRPSVVCTAPFQFEVNGQCFGVPADFRYTSPAAKYVASVSNPVRVRYMRLPLGTTLYNCLAAPTYLMLNAPAWGLVRGTFFSGFFLDANGNWVDLFPVPSTGQFVAPTIPSSVNVSRDDVWIDLYYGTAPRGTYELTIGCGTPGAFLLSNVVVIDVR